MYRHPGDVTFRFFHPNHGFYVVRIPRFCWHPIFSQPITPPENHWLEDVFPYLKEGPLDRGRIRSFSGPQIPQDCTPLTVPYRWQHPTHRNLRSIWETPRILVGWTSRFFAFIHPTLKFAMCFFWYTKMADIAHLHTLKLDVNLSCQAWIRSHWNLRCLTKRSGEFWGVEGSLGCWAVEECKIHK